MSAEIGTGRPVGPDLQTEGPVRMDPHVTAAEALAVFQRKLLTRSPRSKRCIIRSGGPPSMCAPADSSVEAHPGRGSG